ncbi:FKBP-type peptidyl-prolyl cis-trans isomerase [Vibrio sp. SCSIO 43135]|uniref:Peptidyl-prolyl cis-trans isomerase n=1 Tax=Vibrio paucivorans TaxID=2829489 RepID=A0A9X3HU11_9VIBR|nr:MULTISPECIES: FKBP-type peptidyl-prolyl cis-trans isomerase [Vibrio]MCW8336133.1 FKBP-type peptidyl-prolyl cis-trans isomerase [Vibrio paucivorans]USD44009.1 FKBP-type peptidyl-prolyl cis-trans isomerase [Vibrio sp. SCSIO 43135]
MGKFAFPIIIFLLAGFFIYRTWTNHKAADVNFQEGQAFLAENGQKEGVITTESGLQYQVLQEGTGTVHPTANSRVKVHYHGTLIDGTVFDSSVERNEPIAFGLNQVIKGWQEGVQYMVEGQKIRLFVPSTLGYGKSGTGPIPPSATLIFDIELLEIQ